MRFVEGGRRRRRRLRRDWDGSRVRVGWHAGRFRRRVEHWRHGGLRSFHVWRFDELRWVDELWRDRRRRRRSIRRYQRWRILERWGFR
jgi:hypothetical protein